MALIVLIMSVTSQALVAGLEAFWHLKGIGDLNERLRTDIVALRTDVQATNEAAVEFIRAGLREEEVDPQDAAELGDAYEAICADAVDLEERLRVVERQTVNPVARRLLVRKIEQLEAIKTAAAAMVQFLELLEQGGQMP